MDQPDARHRFAGGGPVDAGTHPPAVCVVGLGRVGLAVAAALAWRGVSVTGVDTTRVGSPSPTARCPPTTSLE